MLHDCIHRRLQGPEMRLRCKLNTSEQHCGPAVPGQPLPSRGVPTTGFFLSSPWGRRGDRVTVCAPAEQLLSWPGQIHQAHGSCPKGDPCHPVLLVKPKALKSDIPGGGWVRSDLWWRFNLALRRVLSPSECWSVYAGKPFLFSCLSFRGSKRLKLKYQLIELAPTNLMNSACPGWASSAEKEMDCAPSP